MKRFLCLAFSIVMLLVFAGCEEESVAKRRRTQFLPDEEVETTSAPAQTWIDEYEIPLRLYCTDYELPEGYSLDENGSQWPQTIFVSGPEDVINTISYAQVTVDMTDRTEGYENEEMPYALFDSENQEIVTDVLDYDGTVCVTVPVVYTKVLPLKLDVIDGLNVTAQEVTVQFYEKNGDDLSEIKELSLSGSGELLENETKLNIGVVDLTQVQDGALLHFDLTYLPLMQNGVVADKTEIYAKITFPVRLNQSYEKKNTPYIMDIQQLNIPSYKEPTYDSQAIEVVDKQGFYTIMEERVDDEGNVWGRLKMGTGWIDLAEAIRTVPASVSHDVKSLRARYPIVDNVYVDGTLSVLVFVDRGVTNFSVVQIEHPWGEKAYISNTYKSLRYLDPGQGVQITMAFYGDAQESDVGIQFTDENGVTRCFYIADNGRNNALRLVEVDVR